MSKKNLIIAIFHLSFFYSGGGEKLVLEEIKGLKERGHNVTCFAPTIDRSMCFPDVINKYPIKVFLPFVSKLFHKSETLQILFTCIFFPFIVNRFREFDVVIGANQPGPWLAYLTKLFLGKPYVVYLAQPTRILHPRKIDLENGVWVKRRSLSLPLLVRLFNPFFQKADLISIKNADVALVNGEYMAGVLRKVYGIKPIVCPAGAYPVKKIVRNRWKGLLRCNGFRIRKPYILLTNRHFPQKRFEYAIYSMPEILKRNPHVTLVITGNPTGYTEKLVQISRKLSIENKVILTGYVAEEDLLNLYKNAAVYVYTSPEEDFGMGVIEAMGAGVPVVAWNCAGPSTTIIDGKTGFLIKPYSQEEFTKATSWLISQKNKNIMMGTAAKEHVKNNYSFDRHIDIFESALFKVAK